MADGGADEAQRAKDFDRLYQRLVVRGSGKRPAKTKATLKKKLQLKKLKKPNTAAAEATSKARHPQPGNVKLPSVQQPVVDLADSDVRESTQPDAVSTSNSTRGEEGPSDLQTSQAAQEASHQEADPEPDLCAHAAVVRLRLGRNLRVLARMYRRCPRRLAAQLASSADTFHQFVNDYRDFRGRRSSRQDLQYRGLRRHRALGLVRLEQVAAKLYQRRDQSTNLLEKTRTRVDGKHRLVTELRFFSPPNTGFHSLIGYTEAPNAVALPPRSNRV